ncbi:hypothetical protein PanWU01x14_205470, partial [Parasponia andersonii]
MMPNHKLLKMRKISSRLSNMMTPSLMMTLSQMTHEEYNDDEPLEEIHESDCETSSD